MMQDPWTEKLSDYLDDGLSDTERAALERHLAACPSCAALLGELSAVAARARALRDRPPAAELWPGIAARIAEAPPAGDPDAQPAARALRRRRTFSLPQLAAAAVVAALGSGAAMWWVAGRGTHAPIATAPAAAPPAAPATAAPVVLAASPKYDAAVAELERILARERSSLDPKTVQVLERNLAVIDRALADARRALAADPNNAYLNAHLARTMRWKIDLLREAATLAAPQS
jgi:anti-sigma factor RsiW